MDKILLKLSYAVLLSIFGALSGCSTVRVTDPSATATQQYLTSEAVSRAISQLSFESLRGRKVFIDNSYLAEAEKGFATAEFRAVVLQAGAYVKAERSEAEMIIEMRSNGIGIDRYQSMVGIPAIYGPPTGSEAAGAGAITQTVVTPEVALTKNIRQVGFASISYVAYWADTGEIVTESGPYVGKTLREDWWFLGFGPRTIGNVPVVDRTLEQ
ncbi:MAG TPA: hypothetical protein ENN97_03380 [Phycisphaerales bacterium]|nr:hypothetical protein [Phycisphaerales bacterium]